MPPKSLMVCLAAVLTGCMVGPNFRQPDPPDLPRYTETPMPDQTASAPGVGGAAQRLIAGGELWLPRVSVNEPLIDGVHGLTCAIWIACAGNDGPALWDGVDLAFFVLK